MVLPNYLNVWSEMVLIIEDSLYRGARFIYPLLLLIRLSSPWPFYLYIYLITGQIEADPSLIIYFCIIGLFLASIERIP